jgi:hypothetical protein
MQTPPAIFPEIVLVVTPLRAVLGIPTVLNGRRRILNRLLVVESRRRNYDLSVKPWGTDAADFFFKPIERVPLDSFMLLV